MPSNYDDLNDFHTVALIAFVEISKQQGNWPDSEAVKRKAYADYETNLRGKNETLNNTNTCGGNHCATIPRHNA